MEAALGNFGIFSADRKAAMLGDMLELGSDSQAEHERIVSKAMETGLDSLFLVGTEFGKALTELAGKHCAETVSCSADMSEYVCEGLRVFHFASSQELASWLAGNPLAGHAVLIKGSRGIRMEKVIEML
jgi:UDP-N-acetylmuramoyl-tripeptide--D-alanyl-D-alanine ligase